MDLSTSVVVSYICIQSAIALCVALIAFKTIHNIFGNAEAPITKFKLFKLWGKTTWKMRNVYACLAVHIFDFTTDLLVIRN